MKLILYLVSLSAIALLLLPVVKADDRCFNSIKHDSKEFLEVTNKVVPKTRAGKCLYECMLRSAHVVKDEALIDVSRFMDSLNALKSVEKRPVDKNSLKMIKEIMDKCKGNKHVSGDKCETTGLLLDCAVREAKVRGWKSSEIVAIIRAPYDADQHGAKAIVPKFSLSKRASHLYDLNLGNSFNGPSNVSQAATTPSLDALPTLQQIKYYNYYSFAAYCVDNLKDLSCDHANGLEIVSNKLFHTMTYITVSSSRREIVVTFRGTQANLSNYLLDALLFNTDKNNIKFHKGFYIAVMSIYNDVIKCVGHHRQTFSTYKIVINGHSLGGAMGRLFLYLLLQANQFPGAIYELYTAGEPRIGNKAFADYFNKLSIVSARCVNRGDIVPHVPPTSILGSTRLYDYFVQPQNEFWINDNSGTRFCDPHYYEDPNYSGSLSPKYNSADHSTYFGVNNLTCSEPMSPTPKSIN